MFFAKNIKRLIFDAVLLLHNIGDNIIKNLNISLHKTNIAKYGNKTKIDCFVSFCRAGRNAGRAYKRNKSSASH